MRRKTKIPGEMVSVGQDEQRRFGLVATDDELDMVNEFCKERGRRPLKKTPVMRFLANGKTKTGFWEFEHFKK